MNKIIFSAVDNSNLKQVKKIIKDTKTDRLKIIPKFGLQFFYSKNGRKFLENYKSEFFLDIKASDIPQTITSALNSLKDLKFIYSFSNKFFKTRSLLNFANSIFL